MLGVLLALAQVAAPDLAVVLLAGLRGGRALLCEVAGRLRPWSSDVGARKGLVIWLVVVATFSAGRGWGDLRPVPSGERVV